MKVMMTMITIHLLRRRKNDNSNDDDDDDVSLVAKILVPDL